MKRMMALVGVGLTAFAAAFAATRHWNAPPPAPPGMVWVPGGEFTMGSDAESAWPEEKPAHRVRVGGFWLDRTEVTNAQFRVFVEATGHVTTAEKPPALEEIMSQVPPGTPPPPPETLVPGSLVFTPPAGRVDLRRFLAVVGLGPRRRLAASRGSRQLPRGPRRSPGRPGLVGRCRCLHPMGRQAPPDRGRVGVRRSRRTRRQDLHVGRRTPQRHPHPRQHLAGRVPPQ